MSAGDWSWRSSTSSSAATPADLLNPARRLGPDWIGETVRRTADLFSGGAVGQHPKAGLW